jgi:hypothetical protein
MFSGKLNIINEKFLKGTYNFVLIVELEKETLALRIPNSTTLDIQKSYQNTENIYTKIEPILPKIIQINTKKPYFILYEYFENNNVHKYLKDIDKNVEQNEIFKDIINQCIDHIQVFYDNNIRCVDIKPFNFVFKFTDSKPIVKMIDIDGCFIQDDTMQDINKKLLLLMTLYQFYICFEGTVYPRYNFTETNKKYIIDKIKEKTTFFTVETKEEYKKIFNEINVKGNVFREHYHYLNHYYKDFNLMIY